MHVTHLILPRNQVRATKKKVVEASSAPAEDPRISSEAIEKMLEKGMSTIETAIIENKPIDEADF